MRFGLHLPTYWDDYGATPIHVAIEAAAQAAEALGFDGVWANDLVINPAAARRGTLEGGQVIEPLVTLATPVHLVPRLTLGTNVLILPQRHPVLVAKQAAALHLLSGQRLVLGVGIGHRAEEFALLGADFAHRAAHCRAIAAGGGARTVALYGTQHMRAIGKAGARTTITAHGVGYWRGIVTKKGWAGPRTPDLAADLAIGEVLADLAA